MKVMGTLKRENFILKKFKSTGSGVESEYLETVVIDKDVAIQELTTKKTKVQAHPDLQNALAAIEAVVRYDEGYNKNVEIKVTGVTVIPSAGCAIITHVKTKKSGKSATNSGRIFFESDDFQKGGDLLKMIENLENEVYQLFFKGKFAQLSMFGDEEIEDAA